MDSPGLSAIARQDIGLDKRALDKFFQFQALTWPADDQKFVRARSERQVQDTGLDVGLMPFAHMHRAALAALPALHQLSPSLANENVTKVPHAQGLRKVIHICSHSTRMRNDPRAAVVPPAAKKGLTAQGARA